MMKILSLIREREVITDEPSECDVDDGFDRNVNLDSVVVHCRQILFV